MELHQWINIGFVIAGFALNGIIVAARVTWKLTRVESQLELKIAEQGQIVEEKLQLERRLIGESFTAIRTKIHEVETWSRDNFIRHDAFTDAVQRISEELKTAREELASRDLRLEEKLDRVMEIKNKS